MENGQMNQNVSVEPEHLQYFLAMLAEENMGNDLAMIDDIIGPDQEMQMDVGAPPLPPTGGYHYPISSPHMYDSNYGFGQQQLIPNEELLQTVPVQNPSAMISGAIPEQLDFLQLPMVTIDPSQLQENASSQTMSVDVPPEGMSVEVMSVDQSEVMSEAVSEDSATTGSTTTESAAESLPKQGGAHMTEGEGQMAQRQGNGEPPQLPDFKELLIRIRYRSKEMTRELIKNPNGCLVFYNKPWNFPVPPERSPAGVAFPEIKMQESEGITESQFKFTEQVLKALEKGVYLRCDDYGNIYATRFCRSKIFWYSTEKGPIAEAEITRSMPSLTFQKLERNQEVMVFDNMLFQRKLLHYVINKPTFKNEAAKQASVKHTIPISPAIFFTFAQSWNPMTSALSSCLVSMVVNPVRARMQRQWGNEDRHESYDLSNYRPQISAKSDASMKSSTEKQLPNVSH
ncbi:uncharacterized protein LOC119739332 isoform X2 [Patiria miniata]|uniref:Interferon regulatory factor-3 domain-containing protein n=1 Tax=Patiria miniata TaxID=46514 RepID=A0A914B3S6_PATMI|nr:uncharacterized protein LOC119739332 isoform X2 [Patiria miniata]